MKRRPDSWKKEGACRYADPELFFPTSNRDVDTAEIAKAICAECNVLEQCAEAGRSEYYGIWGGKTERERREERSRLSGPSRHGTRSKYMLELRAGVTPCLECQLANTAYQAMWRVS